MRAVIVFDNDTFSNHGLTDAQPRGSAKRVRKRAQRVVSVLTDRERIIEAAMPKVALSPGWKVPEALRAVILAVDQASLELGVTARVWLRGAKQSETAYHRLLREIITGLALRAGRRVRVQVIDIQAVRGGLVPVGAYPVQVVRGEGGTRSNCKVSSGAIPKRKPGDLVDTLQFVALPPTPAKTLWQCSGLRYEKPELPPRRVVLSAFGKGGYTGAARLGGLGGRLRGAPAGDGGVPQSYRLLAGGHVPSIVPTKKRIVLREKRYMGSPPSDNMGVEFSDPFIERYNQWYNKRYKERGTALCQKQATGCLRTFSRSWKQSPIRITAAIERRRWLRRSNDIIHLNNPFPLLGGWVFVSPEKTAVPNVMPISAGKDLFRLLQTEALRFGCAVPDVPADIGGQPGATGIEIEQPFQPVYDPIDAFDNDTYQKQNHIKPSLASRTQEIAI